MKNVSMLVGVECRQLTSGLHNIQEVCSDKQHLNLPVSLAIIVNALSWLGLVFGKVSDT